jgi:hypothetical protein
MFMSNILLWLLDDRAAALLSDTWHQKPGISVQVLLDDRLLHRLLGDDLRHGENRQKGIEKDRAGARAREG